MGMFSSYTTASNVVPNNLTASFPSSVKDSKLNPLEKVNLMSSIMQKEDHVNKIFPLYMCLPQLIAKPLEKVAQEVL